MKKQTLLLPQLVALTLLTGCVTVTEGQAQKDPDPIGMAESRIALGLGYLENGAMIKAHDNLQQALTHAPDYYRAQLSMAHYYERVGENGKAEDIYQKSARQHPKNGNVLNNYGTFLCKKGEYDKADRLFNRAIEQPYYYLIPASYENAAFCALKAGENVKAQTYFTRAIDYDPHRPKSILNLAKLEVDAGNYTQARLRLMRFHQSYGLQIPSLKLMIDLEDKAGNVALVKKYQSELEKLTARQG
ncbi:type IV pilus biogenesis/stability protein PilW [Vibrio vulnificus]|nr:type IV pilus biogenesis/stability protein PilW [Vibrio vulnificus]